MCIYDVKTDNIKKYVKNENQFIILNKLVLDKLFNN